MTELHGFELISEQEIPEINSKTRLFRHIKTGAELLSVENDDENKCFNVAFSTPPPDSTGLPHIMEHSVLCGSRKYQAKDPFIELIKGSLQTFINAFTAPDKTMYPLASQNLADFYNLVDVYLDTVFYPLITPETLMQEGWHYELESIDEPLRYKGIVFNEMKGAYSSPEGSLYRYSQHSLFPDNVYSLSSGGDPTVMPNLTYDQFKTFYETYYHPSNARIYFYGDDDPQERLRIANEYLKDFDAKEIDSEIEIQIPFSETKHFVHQYDVGEGEPKEMVTINWLLPEKVDRELAMAFVMLDHVLLGTPASPLRKALIESGLGEDTAGGGLSDGLRQMTFSTGMQGVVAGNTGKIEELVINVLGKLASDGIDPETIEASLNTVEFGMREYNTGGFPRGLAMSMSAYRSWLYGGDPVDGIAFEAPLIAVKEKVAAGERLFEDMLTRYFVDNSHRTTVVLEPDVEYNKRLEDEEKARLEKARAAMNADDLQVIIADTLKLRELQETPDTPEVLAAIPALELSDLGKNVKAIPLDVVEEQGGRVLHHDLFTNGILYLDVGFNLQALPQEYLPYVNLFGQALLEMGTDTEDFVKLSQRIGCKTGGIRPSTLTSPKFRNDDCVSWLFLRAKSTIAQTDDLLAILSDIVMTVKLDNQARFKQMVLEAKSGMESHLIPSGHTIVNGRLRSQFNIAGWANEQMSGIDYLFFLRELDELVEDDWAAVVSKLEDIRNYLLNRQLMICNVTVDEGNWNVIKPKLSAFLDGLPDESPELMKWQPAYNEGNEGLTIPAQVNYVGKGACIYDLGYELSGSVRPILKYLGTTWMWEKIRIQGGAYGGMTSFDINSGVFNYLSYRDPNLLESLDNYDGSANFLAELDISESELTKAIIGAIGDMDAYQLPDAKGYTSLVRYLVGMDDDYRQQFRDELLATTQADFALFGKVLSGVSETGRIVVLGAPDKIAAANEQRGDFLAVTKVL
jgi:presequence protease